MNQQLWTTVFVPAQQQQQWGGAELTCKLCHEKVGAWIRHPTKTSKLNHKLKQHDRTIMHQLMLVCDISCKFSLFCAKTKVEKHLKHTVFGKQSEKLVNLTSAWMNQFSKRGNTKAGNGMKHFLSHFWADRDSWHSETCSRGTRPHLKPICLRFGPRWDWYGAFNDPKHFTAPVSNHPCTL